MSRPLYPILFGIISGILLEYRWTIITSWLVPDRVPLFIAFAVGLLGLWAALCRFQYLHASTYLLIAMAVLLGMTRYAISVHRPVHHISRFVDNEYVTIEGFLNKAPENAPDKHYLDTNVQWLEKGDVRYRVCGNVRITVAGKPTKSLRYGDLVRTRLRLRIPRNVGDFDYRAYLQRRNIYLVGFLQHDRYLIQGHEPQGNLILRFADRLRTRIVRFFQTYTEQHPNAQTEVQIIKAVTLGTSRELSPEIREVFRRAGMYHLLVVSGIHIGIFVWGLHKIFQICSLPLQYRSLGLALFLLLYMGLTGFQFPVVRASLMAFALYFSITCNRIPDAVYSLAFSIGVIVLLVPSALFEVSFQLTVGATGSILLVYRQLHQTRGWNSLTQAHAIFRLPLLAILMTLSAMLGIAPLLLFYFQEIASVTVFSNLLISPVVSLFLPFSLAVIVCSLILPWSLAFPILSANVLLAKCFLGLAGLSPDWMLVIPPPTVLGIGLYYALLTVILNIQTIKTLLKGAG